MTAGRVSRAPARGTVFRLYPRASPSGPLYIERVFLLLSCINQLIHHLHLYRSLYSNKYRTPSCLLNNTDASLVPLRPSIAPVGTPCLSSEKYFWQQGHDPDKP